MFRMTSEADNFFSESDFNTIEEANKEWGELSGVEFDMLEAKIELDKYGSYLIYSNSSGSVVLKKV